MRGTTVLAALLALEVALVATEQVLVRSLGQQAIAAALLAAPTGEAALLGLGAVLARIGAHALVPAAIALVLGALLAHRLTGWRWAPRSDPRSPRAGHRGPFRGVTRRVRIPGPCAPPSSTPSP